MKKVMILSICLVLCLSMVSSAEKVLSKDNFQEATHGIKIGVDDVEFNYPVFINEGNTYVSLRDICKELRIPVYWDEQARVAVIDKYNSEIIVSTLTERKKEGVIPDEETALAIGRIILEKYSGEKYEYETKNVKYFLEVEFIEEYNVWKVSERYELKREPPNCAFGGPLAYVYLSKSTGEVININTYSSIPDDFEQCFD